MAIRRLGDSAPAGQTEIGKDRGRPDAAAQDAGDPLFVEAIARAFRVLEAFSTRPHPCSLGELAEATGLPKSAVQRVAHTLGRLGYMEQRPRGGFAPGRKLLDRSFDYQRSEPLFERAMPVLIDLQREVGERVDLTVFDDLTMLYVFRLQARREIFRASLGGRRIPTWCSSGGMAVMAHLPATQVDDILARSRLVAATPFTVTDPARIRARIAEARRQGHALLVQELQIGILAVAAPVLDGAGRPVASVHVTASVADVTEAEAHRRIAPAVVAAAHAIGGD
jgi:DNA-binding IclR family transcriptional regulator